LVKSEKKINLKKPLYLGIVLVICVVLITIVQCQFSKTIVPTFGKQAMLNKGDDCKFTTIGNFKSLEYFPELQKLFINTINNYRHLDAVVFTGDITSKNNQTSLHHFTKITDQIKFDKLSAIENIEFPRNIFFGKSYLKIPKVFDLGVCKLIFVVSENGVLNEQSINLLENLGTDSNAINILFLDHSIYSAGLGFYNFEWNENALDLYEAEKNWRKTIQPLISGSVDLVVTGAKPNFRTATYMEIDGIPYVSNAFPNVTGLKNDEKVIWH